VCNVHLSFSLSLSLSHSLTLSLFLRLNAAGSARGGEQTRLTRVLRRRAETARWEGARSVTMGIRWPSTVVTQLVRSSQGTHVCTTSRPTTHAGPMRRCASRPPAVTVFSKVMRTARMETFRTAMAAHLFARWSADSIAVGAIRPRLITVIPHVGMV